MAFVLEEPRLKSSQLKHYATTLRLNPASHVANAAKMFQRRSKFLQVWQSANNSESAEPVPAQIQVRSLLSFSNEWEWMSNDCCAGPIRRASEIGQRAGQRFSRYFPGATLLFGAAPREPGSPAVDYREIEVAQVDEALEYGVVRPLRRLSAGNR